jgi:hypothetical protein
MPRRVLAGISAPEWAVPNQEATLTDSRADTPILCCFALRSTGSEIFPAFAGLRVKKNLPGIMHGA